MDHVCRYRPVFTWKKWRRITIQDPTRGEVVWEMKAARVYPIFGGMGKLVSLTGIADPGRNRAWRAGGWSAPLQSRF